MLDINTVVSKNGASFKVVGFFQDYDMITLDPYRVVSLENVESKQVVGVAENIVLSQYAVTQKENVKSFKAHIITVKGRSGLGWANANYYGLDVKSFKIKYGEDQKINPSDIKVIKMVTLPKFDYVALRQAMRA